jgi:hypothetical protein
MPQPQLFPLVRGDVGSTTLHANSTAVGNFMTKGFDSFITSLQVIPMFRLPHARTFVGGRRLKIWGQYQGRSNALDPAREAQMS